MNGKRAKELRKAARMLLGPDAPAVDYDMVQQRDEFGNLCKPKVAVNERGKAINLPGTEIPFILSMGFQPELKMESVKGLTKKLKGNYGKYRKKNQKTLDIASKLAQYTGQGK